ncbi:Dihydrolipoamide branched chain transacylase [Ectocarpus siliculosus]|uniref:Dihydrolipoamide acetyltransferase component of pyruvate dehydrogenase complex n=1 Tax=Ectocarpus siliculosus TaxID=2880 RepID=D7FZ94_ECTSI|nr:Dihydrolipoamide branched chain transacylase [Ectocarpus siliculosus]|eukprot:CBJ32711.1 Dihydrolipoamide branched chain transacylase [Ectocarpus siliculosus]
MILSKWRSALGTSTATALGRSTARGISAKIVPSYCRGHTDEPCCYCSGLPISRASAVSPTSTHAPAAGSPRQVFHTRSGQVEFNLSPEVVSGSGGDAPLLPRVSGSSAGGARFKSTAAALDLDVEISRDVVVDGSGDDGGGDSSNGLTSFRLTDIGEGILEVEVLQWYVAPGDSVSQFDKLCEVQSDKANVEITSRYDGVVRKVHWNVGDMVQTGAVLVDIEERAASSAGSSTPRQPYLSSAESTGVPQLSVPSSPHPAVAPPAPAETVTPESTGGTSFGNGGVVGDLEGSAQARRQVLATPAVRRLCREMSIDLALEPIPGTGPGGRLLKGDVLAHASATAKTAASGGPINGEMGTAARESNLEKGWRWRRRKKEGGEQQRSRHEAKETVAVPIKGVQRAMMEAMRKALEVPHMTFCDEVNADRLGKLRSDLKEAAERRGARLSYLPLIVKATSMALTAFPTLNASLSEDKKFLLQHPGHNIGVAMDTEKGLLVPCIANVEEMSVLDIAEELNTLQRLGAAGKLGEEELAGTTFTLSNIGSIGGTYASPVILHPQVCIGALGRMQRVPRFDAVDTDKVVASKVIPVSWSADHRVVDGGTLARFSNTWKAYLENPALMLADTR